ncbi:aminotransferase class I/II-fold pyridoxal phosphate-dependent enzyme [Streptomyces sp. NPDC048483]|uniref:aminotransferase class I/II-fold pyridoxal phosphate-dependent enzyme n=1 Tax=Streptomyces sp. NPDC048483 TaxID=3154927 RepID=UPI00341DBD46
MVSRQAARLVAGSPAIAEAHFRAEAHPYHPELRPDGYLNLGTAENRLLWDLLADRVTRRRPLTETDTRYAPLYGTPALRERIAFLLSRVCRYTVAADDLVVVSGATAALDVIASALCDPGDAIVVPAPYYGAFDTDLAGRSGALLLPAQGAAGDGFRPTAAAIDRAVTRAHRDGITVRAVALASPANPTGTVYPAETLREVAGAAADHGVDIIADEIYANSAFGPEPFTSLLVPAANPARSDRTHVVWGFAKDFGLPGLKVGVLHTPDPTVRAAARALAYFAPVSTDTQALLTELLDDTGWVDRVLAENRRRLAASYQGTARLLDELSIPYVPAQAGCSLWADLGAWLPSPDAVGERALWRAVLDSTRVSIMPGEAFHSPEPGWFRICHTLDPLLVREALMRLGDFLALRMRRHP